MGWAPAHGQEEAEEADEHLVAVSVLKERLAMATEGAPHCVQHNRKGPSEAM